MMSPRQRLLPLRRLSRRFGRNRRGATAVEFALVAPIFLALLFAIMETALMFFAGQVLETATQDTARLIMTGQAQNGGMTQAQFKEQLCSRLVALFDCATGVYIDVQSFSNFSSVTVTPPIDANKNFINNMNYKIGAAGDIVIVRSFYQWPLFVTGLGYDISNVVGSKRLLTATAAFRNEPF